MQVIWWILFVLIVMAVMTLSASIVFNVMVSRLSKSNDLGRIEDEDYFHLKNVDLVASEEMGHDVMRQAPFMNTYAVDPFGEEGNSPSDTI